jgi:hypothetical protein
MSFAIAPYESQNLLVIRYGGRVAENGTAIVERVKLVAQFQFTETGRYRFTRCFFESFS